MPPRHYFNERYADRESLIRLCIHIQEEYKRRGLLHQVWPTTDDIFYTDYLSRLLKILELVPAECRTEGAKALDVGCGEGRLLLALKQLGFDAAGADLRTFEGMNSEGVPRGPLLEAYFREEGVAVSTVNVEGERLPFDDDTFDLVTNIEVIEHLHNSPKNVMLEMRRVLKDGGYLILATPNIACHQNRMKLLMGNTPHWDFKKYYNYEIVSPPSIEYVGHVREFTVKEIEDMLHWEDFDVLEIETYDTMPMTRRRPETSDAAPGAGRTDAAPGASRTEPDPNGFLHKLRLENIPKIPRKLAGLSRRAANSVKTRARSLSISLAMALHDDGFMKPNMVVVAKKKT